MEKKVIVTGPAEPVLINGLEALGFDVTIKISLPEEALIKEIGLYTGIVISSQTRIDRKMIIAAENLEFIARLGSGLDIIDLKAARAAGIEVFSSPEGNRHAVAEHVLGMLLALLNHINRADRQIRQGVWLREENRGEELRSKTLGIIGFGNNGRRFAEVLSGFGMQILAYDKYLTDYAGDLPYVSEVKLEDIQRKADIVSLHVPLTSETNHLIDMPFLQDCKDGVILVNASRGGVVNTEDLVKGLGSGKVSGACLDVFEVEPPFSAQAAKKYAFDKLCQMEQVVLSPHVAGWTRASKQLLSSILMDKIRAYYMHKKEL